MNANVLPKKALVTLSRKIGMVLLVFQMNSCELEVIPPTDPESASALRSSFQFTIQDADCASNCIVSFTNLSENADTYQWDFGDESEPSTVANPSHTYVNPGSYNVTLTAFRDAVEDDTTLTVIINPDDEATTGLQAFTHTATTDNINAQLTTLDHTLTNNMASKIIVVTPVLGQRNVAALGLYYFGNKWMIFTQDLSNIQPGEIFNVVVSDVQSKAFVHQTSAANLRTAYSSIIDHTSLNNKPGARVYVTPIWEQSTDYNNNPVGVVYINNKWEIINMNKANLPAGLKFNVIVSTGNAQSFTHTSTAAGITLDYTQIEDARLNNKSTLRIIATPNLGTSDASPVNPRISGLWYKSSASRWTIFNQNGDDMPTGAGFNILSVE